MKEKIFQTQIYAVFVWTAFFMIAFSALRLQVHAANIAEGTSGTCTWSIAKDGTFSIYPTSGESGSLAEPEENGETWPWEQYRDEVTAIYVNQGTVYAPQNCYRMFTTMRNATKLDVSSMNTSNTTNMKYMFNQCGKVPRFELAHFDVSNVLYFYEMFQYCNSAELIDIHGWDMTKNKKYVYTGEYDSYNKEQQVYQMFAYTGDASQSLCINMDNVKFPRNSSYMFFYANPSEIHMNNVDFSEVYDFTYFMCNVWKNLKELTITNVGSVEHVGSMNRMFADHNYNSQLQSLTLKGFTGAKAVTNIGYMFREQKNLTELNSDFTTGSLVTEMGEIFTNCKKLKYIDLTGIDVSNPNIRSVSLGLYSNEANATINMSGWDMSQWENNYAALGSSMGSIGGETTVIANDIKLPHNNHYGYHGATQVSEPFYGIGTHKIIAHNVDFAGIESIYGMFSASEYDSTSTQPRIIDFTAINTDGIKYLNNGFYTGKKNIYSLDLTWIQNAKIEQMMNAFYTPLRSVNLSTLDTTLVTDETMKDAFTNCAETIQTIILGPKTVLRTTAGLPDVRWVCEETAEALSTAGLIEKTQQEGGAPGTWRVAGRQAYISLSSNLYDVLEHSNYTESTDQNGNTIKIPGSIREGEDPASLYRDMINGGGYWQKISNDLWAYHFFVFNNNTVWKIWEDPVTGYNSSNPTDDPIEVRGEKVVELEPTITNTKQTRVKTGQLSLTKKVVDTDHTTTLQTDQTFVFTITLTGNAISGSQIFGPTAFTDGKASVTLSAGETIILDNIPIDTVYSIQEQASPGFTGTIDHPTGTITEGTVSSVTCTNTKTEEAKKETSSFTVSKAVVSNADETVTEFQFHAVLSGLLPHETYTLSNGTSYQADANGNADVAFKLKNAESIQFLNLPIGCTYLIAEPAGDYRSAYNITDKNGMGKIISARAVSPATNQDLSTQQETLDKGEDVTVQFVNTIVRTEDVAITKISLDNKDQIDTEDKNQYAIDVFISGLTENQKITTSNGILIAEDNGIIETTMYINPAQKIIFYDLPVGTKYKLSEQGNAKIGSVALNNETNAGAIATKAAANKEINKPISTAEEIVDAGENITVAFTNTAPKAAKLKVIKYDNTTDKHKLGGAEFALYKADGTPVNFTADGSNVITIGTNGESEVLESPLFVEGSYYLVETKAPDGYTVSGEPKAFQITAADAGKTLQIEVYDDKLIVFPVTGGDGNRYILSIACILAASAVAMIIYKKRREAA